MVVASAWLVRVMVRLLFPLSLVPAGSAGGATPACAGGQAAATLPAPDKGRIRNIGPGKGPAFLWALLRIFLISCKRYS